MFIELYFQKDCDIFENGKDTYMIIPLRNFSRHGMPCEILVKYSFSDCFEKLFTFTFQKGCVKNFFGEEKLLPDIENALNMAFSNHM